MSTLKRAERGKRVTHSTTFVLLICSSSSSNAGWYSNPGESCGGGTTTVRREREIKNQFPLEGGKTGRVETHIHLQILLPYFYWIE
jgi:hypothetical protein